MSILNAQTNTNYFIYTPNVGGAKWTQARVTDIQVCSLMTVAATAIQLNCELNELEPIPCVTDNLIGSERLNWDVILLGDMFYDEDLADSLHTWLQKCVKIHNSQVYIGDPGRAHLENHRIKRSLQILTQYTLPKTVRDENYGLTSSTVWLYQPDV